MPRKPNGVDEDSRVPCVAAAIPDVVSTPVEDSLCCMSTARLGCLRSASQPFRGHRLPKGAAIDTTVTP